MFRSPVVKSIVFVLALGSSPAWGAGIYKWVDENGKIHFGGPPARRHWRVPGGEGEARSRGIGYPGAERLRAQQATAAFARRIREGARGEEARSGGGEEAPARACPMMRARQAQAGADEGGGLCLPAGRVGERANLLSRGADQIDPETREVDHEVLQVRRSPQLRRSNSRASREGLELRPDQRASVEL